MKLIGMLSGIRIALCLVAVLLVLPAASPAPATKHAPPGRATSQRAKAPTPQTQPPSPQTQAPTPQTQAPASPDTAAAKLQLMLDAPTVWRQRGGSIRFTVTGFDADKDALPAAYLRWKLAGDTDDRPAWTPDTQVVVTRVGTTDDKSGAIFAASVPDLANKPPHVQSTVLGIIPTAQFRVVVSHAGSTVAWVRDIGITSKWLALCLAVLFVAVAAIILHVFAWMLAVPGRGPVLRIISSASGWASLAQLQIILWTLVIGAGSVYVMTLTGGLITITSGTLILLGIAGGSALGSQIKADQQQQPDTTLAPPGQVSNLGRSGPPGDTWMTLSWLRPNGGSAPDAYCVQYRPNAGAGPWINASIAVTTPRLMLVGLTPNTAYDVQVFAPNGGGSSAPMTVPNIGTTAAAPLPPANVPAPVTGLALNGAPGPRKMPLAWGQQAGSRFTIEYRAHDSDDIWQVSHTNLRTTSAKVLRLKSNTDYDFRVYASNLAGSGPYSDILRATTGLRIPRWSDIVCDTDRAPEIDVTRVQMLFFTVISAFFVAMTIGTSSTIPEIPDSYVTLMGISNGVYLGAKFVRR